MRINRKWLWIMGAGIFFVGIFCLPLRFPNVIVKNNSDAGQYVLLDSDHPITENVIPTKNLFSDLSFQTDNRFKIKPDTKLKLTISNTSNATVREVSKNFSAIQDPSDHSLNFPFSPIWGSANEKYTITLSVLTGDVKESARIRKPTNASDNTLVAYTTQSIQPMAGILYGYLLNTKTEGEDIYYYWQRGGTIAHGNNPYTCALDNSCNDHKNPGHFPLFYIFSAISQKMGLSQYSDWIAFWRIVFFGAYLGTALLIFLHLQKRNQQILGIFGAFFWLFNRWSLYVLRVAHVDFLAIFFLVLSVILLKKYRWGSTIIFGLSLAIKQVAIFMAPLYLIHFYLEEKNKRWRKLIISAVAIGIIPALSLMYFILNNPSAVIKGLLFSVTRNSEADFGAPPLSHLLQAHGILSVVWLAIPILLVYVIFWQKKISFSTASLGIFLVFIAFNTVLFNQYLVWFVPFVPLAMADYWTEKK
jgi:hypothetical protein